MKNLYKIIYCILLACISSWAFEKEMTVSIGAGKKECFFQLGKISEVIDIDYQVIDGGHGDLDINFELADPQGRIIFSDYKSSDNMHRHEIALTGDYRICFDNGFSQISQKIIFFELMIDSKDGNGDNLNNEIFEGLTPDEFYDVKVQDIQESMGKIHTSLARARQLQEFLKSTEARDRNKAEENYHKVNMWSFFQVLLMLIVGSIQIFMLRGLFDTSETKARKIWEKFS